MHVRYKLQNVLGVKKGFSSNIYLYSFLLQNNEYKITTHPIKFSMYPRKIVFYIKEGICFQYLLLAKKKHILYK